MGRVTSIIAKAISQERNALVEGTEFMTYGDLAQCIMKLRAACPTGETESIGLVMDQTIRSIVLLLSLLDCGIPVLPVDDRLTTSELLRIDHMARISVWIVPNAKYELLSDEKEAMKIRQYDEWFAQTRVNVGLHDEQAVPYLYQLTSGSTGSAQIARISFDTLVHEGHQYREWFGYRPQDVVVATVPLNHLYGLTGALFASLLTGSTLHICRNPFPRKAVNAIIQAQGTVLVSTPQFYNLLCELKLITSADLATLRFAISAGGPLSSATARLFADKFHKPILQLYGSTETGAIAAQHLIRKHKEGSSGFLLPGVQVKLTAAGRLAVRSSSLFQGYLKADETEHPLLNGWYTTDDLGDVRDGEIFLRGRAIRHINVAGRKVNPQEIEEVCKSLNGVKEAKVMGKPEVLHGEKIVAYLTVSGTLVRHEIQAYLRRHLAEYKVPHEIHIVDAIGQSWKEHYIRTDEDNRS